jgi:DMSO reductase family type II enzyme chaperone
MKTATVLNLAVSQRATMYNLLREPFMFPTGEITARLLNGDWQRQLAACAQGLGFESPKIEDLGIHASATEYEVEFIALYEVGMGGAPCPLHSGHYTRDRMKTMEEVLRFYKFFDYHPDQSADRFPDHINFELEFMAHLAERYQMALTDGGDAESPLRAQRDFVSRNLVSWLPGLAQLIDEKSQISFFKQVGCLISDFTRWDCELLEHQIAPLESNNLGDNPNE